MDQHYDDILVPVDGSKNAKLAFKRAEAIAKNYNAELHIVNVLDTRALDEIIGARDSSVQDLTKDAKKSLSSYQDEAKKNDLKADTDLEFGSPKVTIARDLAKKYNADLIVMGANGLNDVERVLIGSVASYVSRVAPCDVLLVRK